MSPNSEVLQRVGRAPQPGIPQPMPVEAPAGRHYPTELSSGTEARPSVQNRGREEAERPEALRVGRRGGNVPSQASRLPTNPGRHQRPPSASTESSAGEPIESAAGSQHSQRPADPPHVPNASPLAQLERRVTERPSELVAKVEDILQAMVATTASEMAGQASR